jgi:hypothetical protein
MQAALTSTALVVALTTACAAATAANCGPIGSADNFRAHHDNYALINRMQNNGWSGADERALRVQYSFKYTLLGCAPGARPKSEGLAPAPDPLSSEVFVAYTGQFDFYMGTRPSGPVINRISNPGIHWRLPVKALWKDLAPNTAVVLSVEHRSDGQVFEPTRGAGSEVAQRAYDGQDRALFDTISRGSNFLGVHAQADQILGVQRVDLSATLHAYFSQDSAITWGPLRNSGTRIADYDRLWMRAGTNLSQFGYWELAWRIGDRGLKTDSFDLGWQAPESWALPIYARLHRGPMNTLSNYTQRQDSLGMGLRFSNF